GLSAPVTFAAPAADPFSQMRVLSAGDVNGDGYGDLLVGGGANAALHLGGAGGVQTTPAQLLSSVPSGSTATPDARWPIGGGDFYQGVGDINGDGFSDDLAMISSLFGVPEAERLYFGGTTACTSTACPTFVPLLVPGHLNDGNGRAAVIPGGLGDVNGDGFG